MTILIIDTTTQVCSVAIEHNGEVILSLKSFEGHNHAAKLPVFIDELLRQLESHGEHLDAVAISAGPGSYTGLRIGTATAKGICYAMNIPLIALDTLQILAAGCKGAEGALLCPMIDARRMEVYCALFDSQLNKLSPTEAKIIDENSFAELFSDKRILFFGDGAEKCSSMIKHQNAEFRSAVFPLAEQAAKLAEQAYENGAFVDVAYFEPNYLKDYQAIKSKNKVLQN